MGIVGSSLCSTGLNQSFKKSVSHKFPNFAEVAILNEWRTFLRLGSSALWLLKLHMHGKQPQKLSEIRLFVFLFLNCMPAFAKQCWCTCLFPSWLQKDCVNQRQQTKFRQTIHPAEVSLNNRLNIFQGHCAVAEPAYWPLCSGWEKTDFPLYY